MSIVLFLIGLFIGWISGSLAIIILTIIRFGIPYCNKLLKEKEEDEKTVKYIRKMYIIPLILWSSILTLNTFLCYRFLNIGCYGFLTSLLFMILIGFSSTGVTQNNLLDFYNTLRNVKDRIYNK